MWDKLRTRLERFDYRPDPAGVLAAQKLDPDLHLHGRPFFITEGSADRVAKTIDDYCSAADTDAAELLVREQLAKLDEELNRRVSPDEADNSPPELVVRREILNDLKGIFDLGRAAATHSNTDVRSRQRGSIVDAVTNHRDPAVRITEFFYGTEFLMR